MRYWWRCPTAIRPSRWRELSEAELDRVADELNDRPRKRLGYYKPSERIAELCGLTGASSW
jgi:IS30 family transposase